MSERDFCYWLQGFFEIQGVGPETWLTPSQVKVVVDHLNLVFTKVTGAPPQTPAPPAAPAPPWFPPPPPPAPWRWPTEPKDWRDQTVTCSVTADDRGAIPLCAAVVLDDPEAGFAPGEPLGQNLGNHGRPFSFAPAQVHDAAKPLPSC